MFCLSMNSNHLNFIKELNYIPVGLGVDTFSKEYYRDNSGLNIELAVDGVRALEKIKESDYFTSDLLNFFLFLLYSLS